MDRTSTVIKTVRIII